MPRRGAEKRSATRSRRLKNHDPGTSFAWCISRYQRRVRQEHVLDLGAQVHGLSQTTSMPCRLLCCRGFRSMCHRSRRWSPVACRSAFQQHLGFEPSSIVRRSGLRSLASHRRSETVVGNRGARLLLDQSPADGSAARYSRRFRDRLRALLSMQLDEILRAPALQQLARPGTGCASHCRAADKPTSKSIARRRQETLTAISKRRPL